MAPSDGRRNGSVSHGKTRKRVLLRDLCVALKRPPSRPASTESSVRSASDTGLREMVEPDQRHTQTHRGRYIDVAGSLAKIPGLYSSARP